MTSCFFVTDLHGRVQRYQRLFERIIEERPAAVFLGGDLLPHGLAPVAGLKGGHGDFINNFLVAELLKVQKRLGDAYPKILVIFGNDDPRIEESVVIEAEKRGLWNYIHQKHLTFHDYTIYGYACVPPTPFLLKDWDRYDVSRHVDPGCIPPTEGRRTVPVDRHEIEYGTIAKDLERLVDEDGAERSIFLFHSPPYQTNLDRAALDGQMIDHVPLDVNIGSIAIRRFIESYQPPLTFHGHVHESARLTGSWKDRIGKTWCFTAAHDGPELALIRLDLDEPEKAVRELL